MAAAYGVARLWRWRRRLKYYHAYRNGQQRMLAAAWRISLRQRQQLAQHKISAPAHQRASIAS